jgi:hypothetical protein
MPDAPDMPPAPVDTVDRCAELSALLDDPFADRAAVLRGAGLDEAAWGRVQERWVEQLVADEALVARYGEVYETTLRRLSSGGAPVGPAPDTDREGSRFLALDAQPWRAEAAAVQASGTGVAPTLRSGSPPPPRPSPPPPRPSPPPPAEHSFDRTVPLGSHVPSAALPFVPPSRASSPLTDTLEMGTPAPRPASPFGTFSDSGDVGKPAPRSATPSGKF